MSITAPLEQPVFTVSALEAALRGPGGGPIGTALVAHIDALLTTIATDIKSGIPSADFARAKTISEGLIAAREIVNIASTNRI